MALETTEGMLDLSRNTITRDHPLKLSTHYTAVTTKRNSFAVKSGETWNSLPVEVAMKDLGVIFDSELNFVQHCKEKINTAYSYLGIIRRNFIYLDEDAFVML